MKRENYKKALLVLLVNILLVGCKQLNSTPLPNVQGTVIPELIITKTPLQIATPTNVDLSKYYLSEKQQIRLLQLSNTNGGCDLPCFWRIIPGETNWDQTKTFLSTYKEINNDALFYQDGLFPAYGIPFQFIDAKVQRAVLIDLALTIQDELVQRINLYVETDSPDDMSNYLSSYSMRQIFSKLGPPDDILIDVENIENEYYSGYNLLLKYNDIKVAYWLAGNRKSANSICPLFGKDGQITYFRMSIANPKSELDIFPPDWEYWLYNQEGDSYTTKELLGITIQEFYRSILLDKNDCFNIIEPPIISGN